MYISTSVRHYRHLDTTKFTGNIETKNTWARDDPAILILLSACLCGEWGVNIPMASCPDDLLSCGRGLVGGVFLQFSRLSQTCTTHDIARFPSRGHGCSHHILVSSFLHGMRATLSRTCSGRFRITFWLPLRRTRLRRIQESSGHTRSTCTQMRSSRST